jgi:hydrogenase maturation protease
VSRRVVIGIGNEYRRDDGFGPAVVAALAGLRPGDSRLDQVELAVGDAEPARLIELWTGAGLVVVVDAVLDSARHAGDRHEFALETLDGQLPAERPAGSHAVSLGSTVELARVLGRLPDRLVVLAVSGSEFGFGQGLSAPVSSALPLVVERACELVGRP